jgi:hypothetical protein
MADNFKTAAELRITQLEHDAAVKVLGMFESGEVKTLTRWGRFTSLFRWGDGYNEQCNGLDTFNGFVGSIGAWMGHEMGFDEFGARAYANGKHYTNNLGFLFQGFSSPKTTTKTAAHVLRKYLETGYVNWFYWVKEFHTPMPDNTDYSRFGHVD